MSKLGLKTQLFRRVFLGLVGFLFTALAAAGCEDATPLPLPGQWRGFAAAGEEVRWFRLDVHAPTVLTLDATVSLRAPGEPVLSVLGSDCSPDLDGLTYLERTPAHQVLLVRAPGVYHLRLAAQDASRSLQSYKLTARIDDGCFRHLGGGQVLTKDTEEREPDPDGLRADFPVGLCLKDTEEREPDPDGLTLCPNPDDDHADDPSCPTPLGIDASVPGEIGNPWGDDVDVFRFVLDAPRVVTLRTLGETDTLGALYDDRGQRLALDDESGGEGNFEISRALVSGVYTVHVEGTGAEGGYQLSLEARGW